MKQVLLSALFVSLSVTALACGKVNDDAAGASANSPSPAAAAAPSPAGLVRVSDPSQVCMVNNQFMGKPQIPVEVAGKTYFGCCAMCKEKLEKEASARTALDPVSGEPVDKASALIARNEAGKVFYFANEGTLARYGR
jgi:YHS domain-containing protein